VCGISRRLGAKGGPGHFHSPEALLAAYSTIQQHERALFEQLVIGLRAIPGLKLYGIDDVKRFDQRCQPWQCESPAILRESFPKNWAAWFFTWDGNYYAIA